MCAGSAQNTSSRPAPLPPSLMPNPEASAPSAPITTVSNLRRQKGVPIFAHVAVWCLTGQDNIKCSLQNSSTMFTWSDVTLSSAGTPLSANTDSFLNAHRYGLELSAKQATALSCSLSESFYVAHVHSKLLRLSQQYCWRLSQLLQKHAAEANFVTVGLCCKACCIQ